MVAVGVARGPSDIADCPAEELLLLPEYRDEYESLLMPVYGFEY